MEKNRVEVWEKLSPEELIETMYERTGEDGVLGLPAYFADPEREDETLRCVMDWKTPDDCRTVVREFRALREAIERIAQASDSDGCLKESAYAALPEAQKQVFDVWLRRFPSDREFDTGWIFEIGERLDAGDAVSPKENDYYDRFHAARDADCRRRLCDNEFAYRTVIRAMRYHRLLTLRAPELILQGEARALAVALAQLRWCRQTDKQE